MCQLADDEDRLLLERFGEEVVQRNKSFKKWCDKHRITLNYTAMLALQCRTEQTQIGEQSAI